MEQGLPPNWSSRTSVMDEITGIVITPQPFSASEKCRGVFFLFLEEMLKIHGSTVCNKKWEDKVNFSYSRFMTVLSILSYECLWNANKYQYVKNTKLPQWMQFTSQRKVLSNNSCEMNHLQSYSIWGNFWCGSYLTVGKKKRIQRVLRHNLLLVEEQTME